MEQPVEALARPKLNLAKGFVAIGAFAAAISSFIFIADSSHAVLAGFSALAVALLVSATFLRPSFANVVLMLATTAIFCVLIEFVCGFFVTTRVEIGRKELVAKDPDLGWVLRPGPHQESVIINGREVYNAHYVVDAQGHRAMPKSGTGKSFVFVGDSITFGQGLDDPDTFEQAVSNVLPNKTDIINLGVTGYSPAQVLREMQLGRYDTSLKTAKAFFFITAAWHTDRTSCQLGYTGAPRFITEGKKLVLDGNCAKPPISPLMAFVERTAAYQVLVQPRWNVIDRNDVLNYINIVSEASKLARSKYGVPLIVLYIPNPGYLHFTGITDDEIMTILRARGVEVFDVRIPNEGRGGMAIPGDGHPTGAAHRIRAKLLLGLLKKNNPELLEQPGARP